MIDLGAIEIRGASSIRGARDKVRQLARALHFDDVAATRLAAVTSQAARVLSLDGRDPRLGVGLVPDQGARSLVLVFDGWSREPDASTADLLGRFFDAVETGSSGNGGSSLSVRRRVRDGALEIDEAFLTEQRERLRQRSRGELMREVQEKNAALERHQEQLEETVTERTAQLERARVESEQANRAKSQFLSNMSHELRTPLNGVLGYTQVLQRDPNLTREQRESLTAIENCGRHLLTLINDVLDLSKIEAGRLELEIGPCDLRRMVGSVYDIVRPRAEGRGLAFEREVADDLPVGIATDPTKLKQVLVNLLGNSVKFTEEGSVHLRVSGTGDGRIHFSVEDTGLGMTPEEAAGIFDPFKQAEGGKTSGGTGLGLAISKRIVEALGGAISVDSEKGRGSNFLVDLPLEAVEIDDATQLADDTLSGDRNLVLAPGQALEVLVADDNAANRDILVRLLAGAGVRSVQAVDGRDAVDKLREHPLPLVLMDLRMPVLGGAEATREIRKDPELGGTVVLAVSASVLSDSREEMADVGFDDFLAKPIRAVELFRALEKHAGVEFVEAGSEGEGQGAPEPEAASAPLDPDAVPVETAARVAEQLRDAAGMGDFEAASALADELASEPGAVAALGEEIGRLARAFDFDALESLAARLDERAGSA